MTNEKWLKHLLHPDRYLLEIMEKRVEFGKQHASTYKGIAITSAEFDCGGDGCGECVVCDRSEYLERASVIGMPDCTIGLEGNRFVDKYLKFVYGI